MISWELVVLAIFVLGLAFTIWYLMYPEKVKSWYVGLLKFL